ncbi:MAG: NAD(P)-dependent glycerol-3-phosphate dehydrogenase [Candidatus Dependentiae bacterium]|nr:NAD(P)-dependent glycerol-3-phosphate dehydrogenase [Candidatus Dependentiae bacterium]
MKTVTLLGAGAWGTAVATLLAHNGYRVKLWSHDSQVIAAIKAQGSNEQYLPGVKLSNLIEPVTDLQEALAGAQWIFEAVPVKFLRTILEQSKSHCTHDQVWVILSKGMEQHTHFLVSQMIDDVLGAATKKAVLSGPSFAQDVANQDITGATIAASDCAIGLELQQMLATKFFRPYVSLDLIGTQVGGAVKNVLALGTGMLEGAGYKENAKAFLLTRGLHEMVHLATAFGGKQATLYGLSGVGDLVLTATGTQSKNFALGKRLGKGETLEAILQEIGTAPEGVNTVQSVYDLARTQQLELPICQGLYHVMFNGKKIDDLLAELMARPLEVECPL